MADKPKDDPKPAAATIGDTKPVPIVAVPIRCIAPGAPVGCGADGKTVGRVVAVTIREGGVFVYQVAWWNGSEHYIDGRMTLAELMPTAETKWLTLTPGG